MEAAHWQEPEQETLLGAIEGLRALPAGVLREQGLGATTTSTVPARDGGDEQRTRTTMSSSQQGLDTTPHPMNVLLNSPRTSATTSPRDARAAEDEVQMESLLATFDQSIDHQISMDAFKLGCLTVLDQSDDIMHTFVERDHGQKGFLTFDEFRIGIVQVKASARKSRGVAYANEKLQEAVIGAEHDLKTMQTQAAKDRHAAKASDRQLGALEKANEEQEGKIQGLELAAADMREDMEIAASEVLSLRAELEGIRSDNKQLYKAERDELNVFRAMHVEQILEQNAQLKSDCSELHDQLEFSRTEQLKLETERDDAEQQCDGRLATIEGLRRNNRRLLEKVTALQEASMLAAPDDGALCTRHARSPGMNHTSPRPPAAEEDQLQLAREREALRAREQLGELRLLVQRVASELLLNSHDASAEPRMTKTLRSLSSSPRDKPPAVPK